MKSHEFLGKRVVFSRRFLNNFKEKWPGLRSFVNKILPVGKLILWVNIGFLMVK